jgi:ADP-heptose:LPS heptosyltransferase/glycosyltransferase involved in cell wall biosynthesis
VLHALHDAGHELVQLAVNLDMKTVPDIPWRVYAPTFRNEDPYGLRDIHAILQAHQFDALWTTFDPEVPWRYEVPETKGTALDLLNGLRMSNPGFRMTGWFPVDGGPLSDMELGTLGLSDTFDAPVTMSPHVHDLIAWTLQLKGIQEKLNSKPNMEGIQKRLRVIPHGVDLSAYRIPTREEQADAKRRMGIDPGKKVILQLERNQARKQNYLGLELMERLFKRYPDLRGTVMLYQHMQPDEENSGCRIGYNLPAMAPRYGLRAGEDIMWPPGWVPEEDMARTVYACADVFLSTSTGEGFQYPAWEALACGVPLVVPNDSAREAWFGRNKAPNVHLYKVEPRSKVLPQGYNRRMSWPLIAEAAPIVRKLLTTRPSKKVAERGREFVAKHADHKDVQQAWVKLMAEQEDELVKQREALNIVMPGKHPERSLLVKMLHGPGVGDMVMAGPALRALKKQDPERTIRLAIPRTHLELAKLYQLADEYDVQDVNEADERVCIHDLYYPEHQGDWGNPDVHRSAVIAQHVGVDPDELEPFAVTVDPEMLKQVRGQFLETFDVDPSSGVVIALESGNAHRALPIGYIQQLASQVKRMGGTPIITGLQQRGIRTHGVIDMTGQTSLPFMAALVALAGAVVTVDSATLHMAAAVGTPVVGVFTLFQPAARLSYYEAPWVGVIPPEGTELGGQRFPAGPFPKANPGEWAQTIDVKTIVEALAKLLGVEQAKPTLVGAQ